MNIRLWHLLAFLGLVYKLVSQLGYLLEKSLQASRNIKLIADYVG